MKPNKTHEICLDILNLLGTGKGKPFLNLLLALSSYRCPDVIELSQSPLYKYEYTSLYKSISAFASQMKSDIASEDLPKSEVLRELFISNYLEDNCSDIGILQTDVSPAPKPHSRVLSDRRVIKTPNNILSKDRGLNVGLEVSFVNLHIAENGWSLPLDNSWIPLDKTASQVAVMQLEKLLATDKELPKRFDLLVNTLDSGYATGDYIGGVHHIDNLVSIIRFRSGIKVYAPPKEKRTKNHVYGEAFYLINESGDRHYKSHPKTKEPYKVWEKSVYEAPSDQFISKEAVLKNGRAVRVEITRWEQLLLRTKGGVKMSDKPFSLIGVKVYDLKTGKLVFKNPFFLAVFGKRRQELTMEKIDECYKERYNIEPFFRFVKQKMHLVNYQALSNANLEHWATIVTWACWLLYTARNKLKNKPKKWQSYKEKEKRADELGLTMPQAYKAMQSYLLDLDLDYLLPRKSKGGKGRQKGDKQIPRIKYNYSTKTTGRSKKKINSS